MDNICKCCGQPIRVPETPTQDVLFIAVRKMKQGFQGKIDDGQLRYWMVPRGTIYDSQGALFNAYFKNCKEYTAYKCTKIGTIDDLSVVKAEDNP
jgi:hypothetical protein